MPNRDLIEKGLDARASTKERTVALVEAGVMASVIADVCGVGPSTLTKWKNEGAHPKTKEAFERLDVLRLAMSKLIFEKELEPSEAVAWLQSRNPPPPYLSPLEILKAEPLRVLEVIDTTSFVSE